MPRGKIIAECVSSFGSLPAFPRHEGVLPCPKGRRPRAKGSLPPARGKLPSAEGKLPPVEGGLPSAKGSLPRARGRLPCARGGFPLVRGRLPSAWGKLPRDEGRPVHARTRCCLARGSVATPLAPCGNARPLSGPNRGDAPRSVRRFEPLLTSAPLLSVRKISIPKHVSPCGQEHGRKCSS